MKKTGILLFAAAIAFSGAAFAAELSTDNQAVLPVVQTEVKTTEETNTVPTRSSTVSFSNR